VDFGSVFKGVYPASKPALESSRPYFLSAVHVFQWAPFIWNLDQGVHVETSGCDAVMTWASPSTTCLAWSHESKVRLARNELK